MLLFLLRALEATICPNTTFRDTKPLYLLTLVPFSDRSNDAGWDNGLGTISGARVAQNEINNRTDLLHGYHIQLIVKNSEACSHVEIGTGLSNLVMYTVDPPCQPVVAVNGLICSSHTSQLSPVAGHDGYDLIQLASANSPIFETTGSFPHLWHFFGSASEYVNTALAIMDKYEWEQIGLVYDAGSAFHSGIAQYFERQIKSSHHNKTLRFKAAVSETAMPYFEQILVNLRHSSVTIMFVSLSPQQASILLDLTYNEGFVYPNYTWILVETTITDIVETKVIHPAERIYNASNGHIHVYIQRAPTNQSMKLPSGELISSFEKKYLADFEQVRKLYSEYNITHHIGFARSLYDQVWALALALNKSVPVLSSLNLSIDSYSIGQPKITTVIEEKLSNLSFQGAGGMVEFNDYYSVSKPVEIFWVVHNGNETLVGIYDPLNLSNFYVNINVSDLPKDAREKVFERINYIAAVILYIITGAVIMFTTVQLVLYLYYRHHKVIKATSPYLSLFMFAGSYLLCIACIIKITSGSFEMIIRSPKLFVDLLSTNIVLLLNGMSFILVTLFIKLLRVYRIFSSRLKMDLGKYWNNLPLLITIFFLTILPNLIVVPLILIKPPEYELTADHTNNGRNKISKMQVDLARTNYLVNIGIIFGYIAIFSAIIVYLAFRTRKIKHKNFKDTKKLNFFISVLVFTSVITVALYLIFIFSQYRHIAYIVLVTGLLVVSAANQFILFLPKILPILLSNIYPKWEVLYTKYFYSATH